MQGLIRCAVVAGLFCACHSDDTTTPDGDVGGDAGLTVRWTSRPVTWPGDLGSTVTIKSARFHLDSLRVIGDAGPGDLRTSKDAFEVRWEEGRDPPADIQFDNAPTGLYSQIALQIDGNVVEDSYELRGTVVVNNNLEDFVIEDADPLAINLSIDKSLSAGSKATIDIEIDFAHALSAVDFSAMNKSDGKLQLDESDAGITELRKKLLESFKTPNIAPR
ncbi:MAG TPA: hypothetical protein VMZ53_33170 [Kofleriaceae bacterium]|nr:hypothetical protein [Kofleriaceae bacterium]